MTRVICNFYKHRVEDEFYVAVECNHISRGTVGLCTSSGFKYLMRTIAYLFLPVSTGVRIKDLANGAELHVLSRKRREGSQCIPILVRGPSQAKRNSGRLGCYSKLVAEYCR